MQFNCEMPSQMRAAMMGATVQVLSLNRVKDQQVHKDTVHPSPMLARLVFAVENYLSATDSGEIAGGYL
jgi:hypothetical protein